MTCLREWNFPFPEAVLRPELSDSEFLSLLFLLRFFAVDQPATRPDIGRCPSQSGRVSRRILHDQRLISERSACRQDFPSGPALYRGYCGCVAMAIALQRATTSNNSTAI
jgi:hypothetical protein